MSREIDIDLKINALLARYGIEGQFGDPHAGWALALRLALKHEPDFKPRAKSGRRRPLASDAFIFSELSLAEEAGKNLSEACRNLAKQQLSIVGPETWRGIYNRYFKLKSPGPEREALKRLIAHLHAKEFGPAK